MTRARAERYLSWLALGFGVYWLARGISGLASPAGACPLGLAAIVASALGLVAALLAVRVAEPAKRAARARAALMALVLLSALPAALGIALFFAAPGTGARCLAPSLAPFAGTCIWLGLAMVAGWL